MAEEPLTFVDTNVLAYAYDRSDAAKQAVAAAVLESLWESGSGALSTQVLQELYVVLTRKFDPPMTRRDARGMVAAYGEWRVARADMPMILASAELEERHRLSFWDALIVEAARRVGARRLLSEDFESGRSIAGVRIENPFT